MLRIGLPAGGEFALISVYMVLVYDITRHFGTPAQAGFGIGVRLMQALFLPAVAIAFATAPVAGQNFGARLGERVREAFRAAAGMSVAVMLVFTVLCHVAPAAMVGFFSPDPAVVAFGSEYLRIVSWNFVASGLVLVTSSMFQGMGHTLPALASSALRLLFFAAAGLHALAPARLRDAARLVPVGRVGDAPGVPEPVAAAPGVRRKLSFPALPSAAGGRRDVGQARRASGVALPPCPRTAC